MVAQDLAPTFGIGGERLALVAAMAQKGRMDLATQVTSTAAHVPVRARYF
jgi:hypothetical protein